MIASVIVNDGYEVEVPKRAEVHDVVYKPLIDVVYANNCCIKCISALHSQAGP